MILAADTVSLLLSYSLKFGGIRFYGAFYSNLFSFPFIINFLLI